MKTKETRSEAEWVERKVTKPMMRSSRSMISAVTIALLFFSQHCHAWTALRGFTTDNKEAFTIVAEAVETLLEQVSSLEEKQNALIAQVSSLQEERNELVELVHALADSHSSQHHPQRRLEDSCIAQDSKRNGVFVISGCDVRIQNGQGSTASTNGRGNLILGYNEAETEWPEQTGSHNMILGIGNQYRSYSAIVAGRSNTVRAPHGAILGGHHNTVDGQFGTISGGDNNLVSAAEAHVSGGTYNEALGVDSVVLGGTGNTAEASSAVVVGGHGNRAMEQYGVVTGTSS